MTMHSKTDTILCRLERRVDVLKLLDDFAVRNHYKLYRAKDFIDVFATPYKAAVVEKELLEPWFFDHLRETYLDDSINNKVRRENPDLDVTFDETLIVVGDDEGIPLDVKQFFQYIPFLTTSMLDTLLGENKAPSWIYNHELDLAIDTSSLKGVGASFDRIAKELMKNWTLVVNDVNFELTEIEFYYFEEGRHEDTSTHEHDTPAGKWRFHNQGLDISLGCNDMSYGGILIRGIRAKQKYINGPRRILRKIVADFRPINYLSNCFGFLNTKSQRNIDIFKCKRHGISKVCAFVDSPYRYHVHLDDWHSSHAGTFQKKSIRSGSLLVPK